MTSLPVNKRELGILPFYLEGDPSAREICHVSMTHNPGWAIGSYGRNSPLFREALKSVTTWVTLCRVTAYLVRPDGVRPVVDVEHVVAVDLESLEAEHEPLEDGLRGEGDDALHVALVVRLDDGAVDGDGDGGEEALLAARAQLAYRHCNVKEAGTPISKVKIRINS